jgi:hypothetical protein
MIENQKIQCNKKKSYKINSAVAIGEKRLEADIMRDIKNLLTTLGIFFRRIEGSAKIVQHKKGGEPTFAKSENSGFPDYMILKDGKFYALEVKSNLSAHLSDGQAKTITEIQNAGAFAAIVTSANAVLNVLNKNLPTRFLKTDYGNIPIFD